MTIKNLCSLTGSNGVSFSWDCRVTGTTIKPPTGLREAPRIFRNFEGPGTAASIWFRLAAGVFVACGL